MTEEPLSDGEFRKLVANQRKATGTLAELLTAADLVGKGYPVFLPLMSIEKFDLVTVRNGEFLRLQVKMGAKSSLQVNLGRPTKRAEYFDSVSWVSKTSPKYTVTDFDYLVVVDRDTREVFYVPVSDIDLTSANFNLPASQRLRYNDF